LKIMLTGENGQVGWELNRSLLPLGEVIALDRSEADLSKPEELRPLVRSIKPNVIVNAAAYTAVDKAESEEELATTINGASPGVLAEEASNIGALLVHYSTDYVFDGSKISPYLEDDAPNPINAYGRSKLKGEQAIQSTEANFLIFRTSWVYASRGQNFLSTILRLSKERESLKIVADQIGIPTWARLIAETTAHCVKQSIEEMQTQTFHSGLYNLTSSGETSWFGFSNSIVEIARRKVMEGLTVKNIEPIPTPEYPTPARRPLNSRLAIEKLQCRFNLRMPQWLQALQLCMEEVQ
jgi:dTDP-4-dehydrorhamnose reductase